jgi:4-hydroxybenzoate polyprenyltransferase
LKKCGTLLNKLEVQVASLVFSFQNIHKLSKPYIELARYDRPIGIWLLLLPALWGLTMAHEGFPTLPEIALFFMGAVLMRGAGCTINDMVDRRFDGQVHRTQNRPLASGALSFRQALIFLGIQLALAALLLLRLNHKTIILGLIAVTLTLVYPWMKRITYWPQLFLGFTFNWGLLMAFVSTGKAVRPSLLFVYVAAILWTLAYDTVYAYQDVQDDILIGVKSSPMVLHDNAKPFLALCYGLFAWLLLAAGLLEHTSWGYYFMLFLIGGHLYGQLRNFQENDPAACGRLFRSNQWVGILVLLAFLWGYWF